MTPVGRMTLIIGVTLVTMKVLTLAFARAEGIVLGKKATIEFFGWPGMRPALFARRRKVDHRAAAAIAGKGVCALLLGAALFLFARIIAGSALEPTMRRIIVTSIALPALSLMLHFGCFDLLAACHRLLGVAVEPLFRAPLRARSLSEFWSRRWNVGFSEMIAAVVHRPLRRNVGENVALAGSFLASGLLHELAISVPVNAGYGLPTAYFLLHGALVAFERRMERNPGHLWTIFWLAAPLPLLFHPPFLRGVIWPLFGLQ
jgi:hypothetical protein